LWDLITMTIYTDNEASVARDVIYEKTYILCDCVGIRFTSKKKHEGS